MTTGHPAPPTIRSILSGILLLVLLLFVIGQLGIIIKSIGAIFMFLPNKLGLVDMVYPRDVLVADFSRSPMNVNFTKEGNYLLYTNSYDLLVINDAVVEGKAAPWIKVISPGGQSMKVEMISRGLILFDTPFADGRPVIRFSISTPGEYEILHPTRPIDVYFVPDYLTGNVEFLTLLSIIQLLIFGYPLINYGLRKYRVKRSEDRAIKARNRARIEALGKKRSFNKSENEFDENQQNIWRPKR
jgi:hypothetical protein